MYLYGCILEGRWYTLGCMSLKVCEGTADLRGFLIVIKNLVYLALDLVSGSFHVVWMGGCLWCALNYEYLRIRLLHFTISINLFEYKLVLVIVMWDGWIFDHFWYTGLKMSNLGSALKIYLKTIFQFYFNILKDKKLFF